MSSRNDKLFEAVKSLGKEQQIKGLKDVLGKPEFAFIPLSQIRIADQVRKNIDKTTESFQALKSSIMKDGVLEPVLVIDRQDYYLLIAGHRRYLACEELGMETVPARILQKELPKEEILRIQLIENLQREDITPIEEAQAYRRLYEELTGRDLKSFLSDIVTYKVNPERLDEKIKAIINTVLEISGRSAGHLQNLLSLLKLPEDVQRAVEDGRIQVSLAYVLAQHTDHKDFQKVVQDMLVSGITYTVEELAKIFKGVRKPGSSRAKKIYTVSIPDYLRVFIDSPEHLINFYINANSGKTVKGRLISLGKNSAEVEIKGKKYIFRNPKILSFLREKARDREWNFEFELYINGDIK